MAFSDIAEPEAEAAPEVQTGLQGQDTQVPPKPLDVPKPATAAAPTQNTEPEGPWAAFSEQPSGPWDAFGKPDAESMAGMENPAFASGLPYTTPVPELTTAYRNIGNAFLTGLGDGWTGGAIIKPDTDWGLNKKLSEGLDRWLSYPGVKEAEKTALQTFNEGFLFPAVKELAQVAAINLQAGVRVAQLPLQAGGAGFRATTETVLQGITEFGNPQLARDIAGDLELEGLGGGALHGRPAPRKPVVRPTPDQAIREFRTEPFPEPPAAEQFGPREPPVIITPDQIVTAKDFGVFGTMEEWDGTSVYSRIPETPDLRTVHDVARDVDPATFEQYDRFSSARDNARQALRDETERLRSNAEEEIQRTAPHTDEIADLKETLADPRSSARSKRNAEAKLPRLEEEQSAYLSDQDMFDFLNRETPEVADLRREVMANDERMRDLAPQVSAAYREAERRMPPAEAAPEAVPEATEPGPQSVQEYVDDYIAGKGRDSPSHEQFAANNDGAIEAEFQSRRAATEPPLDIAAHVTDRLTRANRPPDEAAAMGALVQAYYETKAQRFGGRKGTAADLYREEAPQIVGRESRGAVSGMLETVNGKSVLTLFRKADATTAIHEFGHKWFNDLLRDAADKDAPGALKVDAAVVRRWLGVEDGQELTRRHQERVARAFENYMMEGHAPSVGLARVFEQFKVWMTKVYEAVKQQKIELNDDLRGVFDRWFSTEPTERKMVAPEKAGPPSAPRQIGIIMRDERVRESVARQIQSQEIIAYAEWQAANRNAGTLATPKQPEPAPGERPRNPRSESQIMREDGVGPAEAKRTQGTEFTALADWQAAQRSGKRAGAEPVAAPVEPSVPVETPPETARAEAQPVPEPVTATPEVYVAKNFGPPAKDMSPVYVKVPKEPKRLISFLKEGIVENKGAPNERIVMRGLKPEPGAVGDLDAAVGGKKGVINARDGEPLDHARERADEAGYFPQGAEDINALYEAMGRDSSGQPVYSMFDDDAVAAYENAVKHNREMDRLAAEHGIDPRGMRLGAFLKAIEDKVGKEEFDAKAIIERARAIDEANEMRDDLTHWEDNEAEHAERLSPDEFERLWGEASASQELVDRGPGDGEPGVSSRSAGAGAEGAGSERGGAGVPGPTEGSGSGPEPARAGGGESAGGETVKPEPLPVSKPGPGLAEQIKRRHDEVPKVGNIRLEYILDGRWDELVAEVMSELSLSGDPRVRAGSVRTMAEHAIFNATADEFYKAKEAWQKTPSEANWADLLNAKANHAAATAAWSTGLTNWAYTGHTYQAIIRANKRIEAEMKAAGDAAPPDQQVLFQRQKEIAMLDALDTPEQVGHALMRDMTTKWDKFKNGLLAFYLSNILSGPVTHAGYLIGGFVNNVVQPLLTIPLQAGVSAIRGTEHGVAMGEAGAFAYGLMNGATKGIAPSLRALKTGETFMEGAGPPIPHEQMILPTLFGGVLGKILETPIRAVRAIHVLNYGMRYTGEVSRMAYRDALMKADAAPGSAEFGAAMQRYINNIPEEDMAYAHDEAIRSALMRPSEQGSAQRAVVGTLNKLPGGRYIVPFPQIGMNLAEEGLIRTTPLGLLSKTIREDIRGGGAKADIALGRMAAGSGILLGVMGLTLNGSITGPGPDASTQEGRDQRRLLEAKGWAPFSVRWGDSYIPLRKALGPIGELIGVSATLADAGHAAFEGQGKEAWGRLREGFGVAVLDETWLRGLHDFFDAATHADQKIGHYLTNFAEGFVPFSQFLSQTARQVDPYVRQAETFLEHVRSRIPFASKSLEPKIGPFGDPVLGHSTMGIHAVQPDPVADRMLALGMGAAPFEREIKHVPMTEEQKTQYGTYAGHLTRQLLQPMVTAPGFDQLPAGMQIKQIEKRISTARHNASLVVQAKNPQMIIDAVTAKQKTMMEGRHPGAVPHMQ